MPVTQLNIIIMLARRKLDKVLEYLVKSSPFFSTNLCKNIF